jgi:hypothetical protein
MPQVIAIESEARVWRRCEEKKEIRNPERVSDFLLEDIKERCALRAVSKGC